MTVKSYRELEVWKKGIEIVDDVYAMTREFPQEERFGLSSQMQRVAVSIPSNVAEGFTRQHTKEYQQLCCVALGSCAELETQTVIAKRRGYSTRRRTAEVLEHLNHETRMSCT